MQRVVQASLKDLERRREETIQRIADERGKIVTLAENLVPDVASIILPAAIFMFHSHPYGRHVVRSVTRIMRVWRFVRGRFGRRIQSTDDVIAFQCNEKK
ncbi:MAG: hypothetical protein JWN23_1826 [Rhodocyclales bacterium]|nr:hypothetical protein [Rhodocyclales bacterium]